MILPHTVDLSDFKQKALRWANTFEIAVCLNSNGFQDRYSKFDFLIAAGAKAELRCSAGNAFSQLERFSQQNTGWVLGILTYDLKNEIEDLTSANADHLHFPDLYFFVPEHLIIIKGNDVEVISDDADAILKQIDRQVVDDFHPAKHIAMKSRFTKAEYIETVKNIQQHILRGDIYETNFCQEFYAEDILVEPLSLYRQLNDLSPAPFSSYFKLDNLYVICASPERFLTKRGNKLISQPIKGTARRGANITEDEALKKSLKNHPKEQQENVMIVDLVRNDLTKSAVPGTVAVEELFGIYTFEQVHQMVSTIVCDKNPFISDVQAIKNTFPMGSMTGAPKVNAMRLMEQFERSKRGAYSGTIGYFSPDGDFDFNVVIRSLMYNTESRYLSFQVGSAITHNADPEKEYGECLLKAKAILQVLGQP